MNRGTIGEYSWGELLDEQPDVFLPAVVRALAEHVVGLRGVNVSWDSGLLSIDPAKPLGWTTRDGHAISPVITDQLVREWPYSGGFDEWYFFRTLPEHLHLVAWCNWHGVSLAQWRGLAFPDGVDLAKQLSDSRPELVVGEGDGIYVLARSGMAVESLGAMRRGA